MVLPLVTMRPSRLPAAARRLRVAALARRMRLEVSLSHSLPRLALAELAIGLVSVWHQAALASRSRFFFNSIIPSS